MSNLQVKEIKGISFKNAIKFAICHDEFYLYSDNRDTIYTFDSKTITNNVLPSPDKKIRGNITTLDFSPSRKYAAAGYSDGGIQVFDLDSNKAYKLLSKPNNNPVQSILFYSDTFLLAVFANGVFLSYKIAFILSRDNIISNFSSKPLGLYRPAVYRFTEGTEKSSKIILPNFVDNFVISTEKSFNFSLLAKDFISSKSKLEIPTGNLTPCFYTIDSRTVLMAITYTDKIEVYSLTYTEDIQITKQSTIATSIQLIFLSFLSSMILIGHDLNCQHFLMFSLDSNTSSEIECPISGFAIQGGSNDGPVFFKDNKLYRLDLQPFTSTIEMYSDSIESAEDAINFCKKAISNDPLSTIGLPNNQNQRILVIERSISQILTSYLINQLDNQPSNASSIADKFIKISQDLQLQDWLINDAVPVFEKKGLTDLIIEKIIQVDPAASLFTYNRSFVESVISCSNKIDIKEEEQNGTKISNFLLSLPNRILPPVEIIKYSEKVGSSFLLAQIYSLRLGDIKSALQVLANSDLYDNVCITIIHNQDKINTSMRWAFTYSDGRFPFLEKICLCKEANDVFQLFECTVDEKRGHININDYANAMLQTLFSLKKEETKNKEFITSYLSKIQNMILQKRVKLLASSLKCLVSIIFSKKLPDNDSDKKRYEKLLIYILTSDVPVQFKDQLLQLCPIYGFNDVKKRMEEGARKYESTIKESLFDPKSDVFKIIDDMISKAQSNLNELNIAKTSIKNAIFAFAPVFIIRDVKQFSNLIIPKFQDSALAIIREVNDENMRNILIKHLYEKLGPNARLLRLPSDIFIKYSIYLANYYPTRVCQLIQAYQGAEIPIEELIPICDERKIYDALAFLHELTSNVSNASDCLVKFQQTELVLFAQGKSDLNRSQEVSNFIIGFIKERIKKKAILDETRKMCFQLVTSMLAPLYCLQKEYEKEKSDNFDDKVNFLTSYLKIICSTVANVVSYPALLEIFIHHFQELNFGFAKLALSSVMNDYAYDLDTTNAMCELYRQDEINDHSKFILNTIKGTENDCLICNTCKKRLIGGLDQIQIFPCGHVFHRNLSCLPKQVCPVCNPEERLDQDIPPPTQSVNIGRSQLRRFEFMLRKHDSVFRQKEMVEMKKDQIIISPALFASFS